MKEIINTKSAQLCMITKGTDHSALGFSAAPDASDQDPVREEPGVEQGGAPQGGRGHGARVQGAGR